MFSLSAHLGGGRIRQGRGSDATGCTGQLWERSHSLQNCILILHEKSLFHSFCSLIRVRKHTKYCKCRCANGSAVVLICLNSCKVFYETTNPFREALPQVLFRLVPCVCFRGRFRELISSGFENLLPRAGLQGINSNTCRVAHSALDKTLLKLGSLQAQQLLRRRVFKSTDSMGRAETL